MSGNLLEMCGNLISQKVGIQQKDYTSLFEKAQRIEMRKMKAAFRY